MSDDLYQQAIMDMVHRASGQGRLESADGNATLDNPLCGDRVSIEVRRADGRIAALAHQVRGCALCKAAATALAEGAVGKDASAIAAAAAQLQAFLKEERPTPPEGWPALDAFAPVRAHKSRFDCVLLPFRALRIALDS